MKMNNTVTSFYCAVKLTLKTLLHDPARSYVIFFYEERLISFSKTAAREYVYKSKIKQSAAHL